MTAIQIKSIVESVRGFDLKSTDSYEDVISQIGGEASNGKQSYMFEGCLHREIIEQLKLDGFHVDILAVDDSVRNNATFVSWK